MKIKKNILLFLFLILISITIVIVGNSQICLNLKEKAKENNLKLYIYQWNFLVLTDPINDKNLKSNMYDFKIEVNSNVLSHYQVELDEFERKIISLKKLDDIHYDNITYIACEFKYLYRNFDEFPPIFSTQTGSNFGLDNIEKEETILSFSLGEYLKINNAFYLYDSYFLNFLEPFLPKGINKKLEDNQSTQE